MRMSWGWRSPITIGGLEAWRKHSDLHTCPKEERIFIELMTSDRELKASRAPPTCSEDHQPSAVNYIEAIAKVGFPCRLNPESRVSFNLLPAKSVGISQVPTVGSSQQPFQIEKVYFWLLADIARAQRRGCRR